MLLKITFCFLFLSSRLGRFCIPWKGVRPGFVSNGEERFDTLFIDFCLEFFHLDEVIE